jgi:hypothetical protein
MSKTVRFQRIFSCQISISFPEIARPALVWVGWAISGKEIEILCYNVRYVMQKRNSGLIELESSTVFVEIVYKEAHCDI